MIGKGRTGRFWAIVWHGEEECSFHRKLATRIFDSRGYSSEKLRWAVASKRDQECHSDHLAFLTDGTDSDVDSADSDHLFLPSLLPSGRFCHSLTGSQDLTTYCDGVVSVSVRQ